MKVIETSIRRAAKRSIYARATVQLALLAASLLIAALASAQSVFNKPGNILIADQFNNRIIEVDPASGKIVWSFGDGSSTAGPTSIVGPNDAQRVGNLTVIAGTGAPPGTPTQYEASCLQNGCPDNRVIVVDQSGKIVWQYGQAGVTGSGRNQLNTPVQVTFLPSKHLLITDQGNERVIEVDQNHIIRWQYGQTGVIGSGPSQLSNPNSAELLENGDILIADENNNRVIEVDRLGNIVWQYAPNDTTLLNAAAFASRLPGGNTLITDSGNARVLEVDPAGNVVWSYSTLDPSGNAAPLPTRAIRLWNGLTLISDQYNDRVIEVNKSGSIVAQFGQLNVIGSAGGLLNAPYDSKLIGDFTGITPPFGAFTRKLDHSPFPF